ncbi:MAG TPA: hypothetical protein VF099_08220, partial [Ktedonobacterales bacterium]
ARVLIIDDLITRGGSIIDIAHFLDEHGIIVKDVIVLIDREQGAGERLHQHGYNLISILKLEVMLNYYMTKGLITEETFRRCMDYVRENQFIAKNHSNGSGH